MSHRVPVVPLAYFPRLCNCSDLQEQLRTTSRNNCQWWGGAEALEAAALRTPQYSQSLALLLRPLACPT